MLPPTLRALVPGGTSRRPSARGGKPPGLPHDDFKIVIKSEAWEKARAILEGVRRNVGCKLLPGSSTALVGAAEQVVDYYDIGCTTFLIRGFDPLDDAREYGRELIPMLWDAAAHRLRA